MSIYPACTAVQRCLDDARSKNRRLEDELTHAICDAENAECQLAVERKWNRQRSKYLDHATRCLEERTNRCLVEQQRKHVHLHSGFTATLSHDRTAFLKTVRLHPDSYESRDYHAGLFGSSADDATSDCDPLKCPALNVGNSAVSECHILTVNPEECHILTVDPEGEYIRIFNTSSAEWELGCHMIIQILGRGQIVLRYRLPYRLAVPALGVVTLWRQLSPCRKAVLGSDYICHGVVGWWVRPNCTTTLCRPDGQAIAWTTAARLGLPDDKCYTQTCEEHELPVFCGLPEVPDPDEFWSDNLRNSIEVRLPSLDEQHMMFPCRHRQSQCWTRQDDCCPRMACLRRERPIPEICFGGAPAQRMGSCFLRKFDATPATHGHCSP